MPSCVQDRTIWTHKDLFSLSASFQLSDMNDDFEYSVQFTKNSLGLGFTISSSIADLNSGNDLHTEREKW